MDLVSLIIPVYNAEKFIEKCLDSVIAQTYTNFEVIVIDDGSVDNTKTICEKVAKKDNRIKLFSKANSGVSDTRNMGLEIAQGKYIAFLDADDYIDPDFINVLYSGFNEKNCAITACNIYSDFTRVEKPSDGSKYINYTMEEVFFNMCRKATIYPFVWNKMFVSKIIKENDLKFDTSIIYGEDTLFLLNYYACSYNEKMAYAPDEKLYHYVTHPESAMASRRKKGFSVKWLDQIECLEKAAQFAESKGLNEYAGAVRIRKTRTCAMLFRLFVPVRYRGKEYFEVLDVMRKGLPELLKSDLYDDKMKKDLKICAKSPYLFHYLKRLKLL